MEDDDSQLDSDAASVSPLVPQAKPKAPPILPAVAPPIHCVKVSTPHANELVRELYRLFRKNGFVTLQEIIRIIPECEENPDLIENVMSILDQLEVILLDEDDLEIYEKALSESRKEAKREVESRAPYDSFDIYLRQLGQQSKLSAIDEVELFQHIEDADEFAEGILFSNWLTLPYHMQLAVQLLRGDDHFGSLVDVRKVQSREEYAAGLQSILTRCKDLNARLDFAWGRYVDELDADKRPKALSAYRQLERSEGGGCRQLLRGFRFKIGIFEKWLDSPFFMDASKEARGIVNSLEAQCITSSGTSPSGFHCELESALGRAIEFESKWRLKPSEFLAFEASVRGHLDESRRTKSALILHNLGLFVTVAKKFENRGVPLEDLIQEGNLALIKIVDKFNHRRGYRFATLASWWVTQVMDRTVKSQASIVRIPVHLIDQIERVKLAQKKLSSILGRPPSAEEIAGDMGVDLENIQKALKMVRQQALDESLDCEDGLNPCTHSPEEVVGRHVVEEAAPETTTDLVSNRLLREKLDYVLRSLAEREKEVLILRYGLLDGVQRTLEEVGRHFKVTRERIRQIEAKALRKMRHPTRMRQFQGIFEGRIGSSIHLFKQSAEEESLAANDLNEQVEPSATLEAFRLKNNGTNRPSS